MKINYLTDNVYLLPCRVQARAKVARRDAVDDMLASYWRYVNNMFCADSDRYFDTFTKATETCKRLREET
jgi:hypothetical protein